MESYYPLKYEMDSDAEERIKEENEFNVKREEISCVKVEMVRMHPVAAHLSYIVKEENIEEDELDISLVGNEDSSIGFYEEELCIGEENTGEDIIEETEDSAIEVLVGLQDLKEEEMNSDAEERIQEENEFTVKREEISCVEVETNETEAGSLSLHYSEANVVSKTKIKTKCNILKNSRSKTSDNNSCSTIYDSIYKPFTCNVCCKVFKNETQMAKHYCTHSEEKAFKCKMCGKSFTTKSYLIYHTRIHTGEKPLKCTKCEKSFNRINDLNSHIRTHTGERPFKCDLCDKTYTQKSHLTCHYRTHTGESLFKCPICGKDYNQKGNLNSHYRTHTGKSPFKCLKCGKTFKQKYNLVYHIGTHTKKYKYNKKK